MINEETTLEEILKLPHGREVLSRHGVPCMTCPMSSQEVSFLTIGKVADMYGLKKGKIIDDLNKKDNSKEK